MSSKKISHEASVATGIILASSAGVFGFFYSGMVASNTPSVSAANMALEACAPDSMPSASESTTTLVTDANRYLRRIALRAENSGGTYMVTDLTNPNAGGINADLFDSNGNTYIDVQYPTKDGIEDTGFYYNTQLDSEGNVNKIDPVNISIGSIACKMHGMLVPNATFKQLQNYTAEGLQA